MRIQATKPIVRYLAAVTLLLPVAASAGSPVANLGSVRMVAETGSAFGQGNTLAVRFAGRMASQTPGPDRLVFTGPMTSLATGHEVGDFTWDLTCQGAAGFPCGVYEVTNTFRFAEGTVVTKALAAVVPDGSAPGFFHVGIHPDGGSVIDATGIFAGRTSRAHMSGRHAGQEFPTFVTFDDFWLIELDRR